MSILAELCYKFQTHPENLATEALGVLLETPLLREAFSSFLAAEIGAKRAFDGLTFRRRVRQMIAAARTSWGGGPTGASAW